MSSLRCFTLTPGFGYGDAAIEVMSNLIQQGINIRWSPVQIADSPYTACGTTPLQLCRPDVARRLAAPLASTAPYQAVLLALPPVHSYPGILDREIDVRRYAYCTWELEQTPKTWVKQMNRLDGVLVPSHFNARSFRRAGIEVPIAVAPHCPREQQASSGASWRDICTDRLVFYTIATWSERKNMAETIRAYLDAFSADDPVLLLIKTDAISIEMEIQAQLKAQREGRPAERSKTTLSSFQLARILADYPHPAPIHLIAETVTAPELDEIHAIGDCFISMSHSEGWGLGAYDALQAGNPVIMPGFGGQMDYLGEDYPLLVDYELENCHGYEFERHIADLSTTHWALPKRAHASGLMQRLAEQPMLIRKVGNEWKQRIARVFNAQRIAGEMASFMGLQP